MIPENIRRQMRKAGFQFGAYDGANRRRFVLFTTHDAQQGNVTRREFDTKRERDAFALQLWNLVSPEAMHKRRTLFMRAREATPC